METLFVIAHALLWSIMEVETEGKRGWMYDSQTQCSGILAFTWYHIFMNVIAFMTVFFIVRAETVLKDSHFFTVFAYNLVLWFVVEDVGWFIANGMTYRTAPWQNTFTAVISTLLPLILLYEMRRLKVKRKRVFDFILVPILLYVWIPFPWTKPFDPAEPYTPRHTYCN